MSDEDGATQGHGDDEQPVEADVPKTRSHPRIPTNRDSDNMKILDTLSADHGVHSCVECVEGRGVGGQHRPESVDPEEEDEMTLMVAFDYGFMTREGADAFPTFPILMYRDNSGAQRVATWCERKTQCLSLVGFIRDSGLRRETQKCDNEPSTQCLQGFDDAAYMVV